MRATEYTYLITSATEGRRAVFQSPENARLLMEIILHHRDAGAYQLHAFVIMPEHFHALITPSMEHTVEKCAQLIKGGFAFRAHRKGAWQRSFNQQTIQDADRFMREVGYIEKNAMEKGEDWPFVSLRSGHLMDPMPSRFSG